MYRIFKMASVSHFNQQIARSKSWKAAATLLLELQKRDLNIVTAESLTAGLIAARLVDIPTFGKHVYGGFVVYSTDAKRELLGINSENVYTPETASQMAVNALQNSSAMVAVSVTGNAGPVPEEEHDTLGLVYIGCAIRHLNKVFVRTDRVRLCSETFICQSYYDEPNNLEVIAEVRSLIRELTVSAACKMVITTLREFDQLKSRL